MWVQSSHNLHPFQNYARGRLLKFRSDTRNKHNNKYRLPELTMKAQRTRPYCLTPKITQNTRILENLAGKKENKMKSTKSLRIKFSLEMEKMSLVLQARKGFNSANLRHCVYHLLLKKHKSKVFEGNHGEGGRKLMGN